MDEFKKCKTIPDGILIASIMEEYNKTLAEIVERCRTRAQIRLN